MSAKALAHVVFVKTARFPDFPLVEERLPAPPTRAPAVSEADTIRESARRDGLARGREEGRAAALAEWTPRLTALAAALDETLAVARAERERLANELTGLVPEVALSLARKVVERELTDAEGALRTVLDAVTRRLTDTAGCVLRVAPDVAAALEACRAEGKPMLAAITVRADDRLRSGDWVIESDRGTLDGRLATQFEEAARILTEPDA